MDLGRLGLDGVDLVGYAGAMPHPDITGNPFIKLHLVPQPASLAAAASTGPDASAPSGGAGDGGGGKVGKVLLLLRAVFKVASLCLQFLYLLLVRVSRPRYLLVQVGLSTELCVDHRFALAIVFLQESEMLILL